ncbi:hypothetical protein N866_00280 [Actinotalea ferrariae CF5-4]|uniref:Uncharacterized protein n=1 Tax=Actinotalea ferrariae CF5-4 TaxID=948458 RepID=A0A021VVX6_9CELL|nr:hypothetical protein [Actinotalea ferrariae]EYR65316.1 hypothetical protein N866_00280 [Actinotalea ferrariae CF5-4]
MVFTENPYPSGPSAQHLIDEAVPAGDLDEPTGLMYGVWAQFHDPRLPDRGQHPIEVTAWIARSRDGLELFDTTAKA